MPGGDVLGFAPETPPLEPQPQRLESETVSALIPLVKDIHVRFLEIAANVRG
jgi:hypothetical protein